MYSSTPRLLLLQRDPLNMLRPQSASEAIIPNPTLIPIHGGVSSLTYAITHTPELRRIVTLFAENDFIAFKDNVPGMMFHELVPDTIDTTVFHISKVDIRYL